MNFQSGIWLGWFALIPLYLLLSITASCGTVQYAPLPIDWYPPGALFSNGWAVFAILAPMRIYRSISQYDVGISEQLYGLVLFWTITGLHVVWCANKSMIITPKS